MNKILKFICFSIFLTVFSLTFAFFSPIIYSKPVYASEFQTSAKSMMVMETSSLRPLYFYNENEKLAMASTTKIITAIYAIEHNDDLDKIFEIPKEATNIPGTTIGLIAGEHLTIKELLYGLMLRSGNDSAVALAIATSGSEQKFIDDVNEFLAEKGFDNTHIDNPHGLDSKTHYTTASDLAKITSYALKNKTFSEIVNTKEMNISNEKKSKVSRHLVNKNRMLKEYKYANGVKTGYTGKAGRCFVGSATKDNMQVVCVLLNCRPMFEECEQLIDKAFNEFELCELVNKDQVLGKINIEKSKQSEIILKPNDSFKYPLREDEKNKIKMSVNYAENMSAPIREDEAIAEVIIKLENQLIFSDKIYNINYIEQNTFDHAFDKVVEKM